MALFFFFLDEVAVSVLFVFFFFFKVDEDVDVALVEGLDLEDADVFFFLVMEDVFAAFFFAAPPCCCGRDGCESLDWSAVAFGVAELLVLDCCGCVALDGLALELPFVL